MTPSSFVFARGTNCDEIEVKQAAYTHGLAAGFVCGDAHHPPQLLGSWQGRMGGFHHLQIGQDIGREGADPALGHVHKQREVFGGGRQPAFLGMAQFAPVMDTLFVIIDQLQGGAHRCVDQ